MTSLPSINQWKQIFKVLKKNEKITFLMLILLTIVSFIFLVSNFYLSNTIIVPSAGGSYVEGVIGQPRFINPIYGETNDIDRTLIGLVFSGLMTYDKEGNIVEDLAESYKISEDGKTYEFKLKDNIFWHDGKQLTADDVEFTIKTIQNSDYKSPLRASWIDVEVEKISDKSLKFKLKSPYNSFLENCTLKIIPKHIWEEISPENFILSSYNLQPIGTGFYKFTGIEEMDDGLIKTIELEINRRHYNKPAFISKLYFRFFGEKKELVKAVKMGQVDGFTQALLENNGIITGKDLRQGKFSGYSFKIPRYFAVFFNTQKSSIFSDKNIRKAFIYAANKEEIIKKISLDNGILGVDSPILPDFFSYEKPLTNYEFNVKKAESLLDKSGFKLNSQGKREKAINKKPAFQFKNYLKTGSRGTDVNQLQLCLARLDDAFKNLLKNEINGTYGKATESAVAEFQKKYLSEFESTGEVGPSTRKKLNELCITPSLNSELLKITIVTIDQPQLVQMANFLKDYWQNIGATIEINAVSLSDLKPIIKNRIYQALLYGEALGAEPDLYPFWHSSQKIDPGLNLSAYENKDVDKLLKEARETLDKSVKQQKYEKLQEIIIDDAPALFLYNPDLVYWVSEKVQGINNQKIIDPAKRFLDVASWFIKTKRVWR